MENQPKRGSREWVRWASLGLLLAAVICGVAPVLVGALGGMTLAQGAPYVLIAGSCALLSLAAATYSRAGQQ